MDTYQLDISEEITKRERIFKSMGELIDQVKLHLKEAVEGIQDEDAEPLEQVHEEVKQFYKVLK